MRWESLQLAVGPTGADARPAAPALFGPGAVVRTFDTPQFRGMTFYEVQARSVLNQVPAASRLPFRWTVNPYRGCSHACVYCQDRLRTCGQESIYASRGTSRAPAPQ